MGLSPDFMPQIFEKISPFVRALKRRDKSSRIPVLLMSSKTEEELRAIVAEAGADGYLTKPFSADKLVRTMRTFLAA